DDRLVAAYRAMDVLVYPIPGTDKTCRTVREALASGIPVIAPKIGFLPELLKDGVNGRFMDLSAQSLANVLAGMISDQEKLCQMAQNAARIANTRFSTRHQAQKVLAFYDRLLGNTHP
ncbi:MAG: glycosyltransferase, partial [Deltaproteobacteria bacterium]|nr:glycosyltransferase [Deltaproteobacteria bacterium]